MKNISCIFDLDGNKKATKLASECAKYVKEKPNNFFILCQIPCFWSFCGFFEYLQCFVLIMTKFNETTNLNFQ